MNIGLVSLRRFRRHILWQPSNNIGDNADRINHNIFCTAWMYVSAIYGDETGICAKSFFVQLTGRITVYRICKLSAELLDVEEFCSFTDFFVWRKTNINFAMCNLWII